MIWLNGFCCSDIIESSSSKLGLQFPLVKQQCRGTETMVACIKFVHFVLELRGLIGGYYYELLRFVNSSTKLGRALYDLLILL